MSSKFSARDYLLTARHYYSHSHEDPTPRNGSLLIYPSNRVHTREDNGAYVEALVWISDDLVEDFYKGDKK